jgi:two-component system alkaline phosphatase synthesis response regulator PhoP
MAQSARILLVDDEPSILDFLSYNLENEGFQIQTASNGRLALELAKKFKPDVVVLDLMMPEMDGMETCEALRKLPETQNCLIVFLTARNEDSIQVAGLDAGADDYIAKPIKPKILVSRIHALLRRRGGTVGKGPLVLSNLTIDTEQYKVFVDNNALDMPRKEFELLLLLASKPGKVFTREAILDAVWGTDVVVGGRTIDVHIRKLREKIGEDKIGTIKGVGYKFEG